MPQDTSPLRALRHRVLTVCLALALASASTVPAATLNEARTLAAQGKFTDALGVVDDVLVKRPEDISALLLRGVLLSRSGRSDHAIEVFNAIAKARPELPEPHNNLAVLYAAQGRYEEARGALVEAIRLQSDYALAHENLGDVYAKLAALSYARANQIDPGNGSAADKSAAAESLLGGSGEVSSSALPTPAPAVTRPAPQTSDTAAKPAAPESARSTSTTASSCVRVKGVTPPTRADGVARWLQRRGMRTELAAGDTPAQTRTTYRVFVPSLGSKAAARKRLAELRQSGISDLIMITDADERYGISLGVFAQRESAQRRVRQLEARGIDTRIADRTRARPAATTVIARGEFAPADFARAFPDLLPEIVDCP